MNHTGDAEDKFLAFAGPSPTSTDADGPRGTKSVMRGLKASGRGFSYKFRLWLKPKPVYKCLDGI